MGRIGSCGRTQTDPASQIFVEMPRASKAVDNVLLLVLLHEEQVEHLERENESVQVKCGDRIVEAHKEGYCRLANTKL